MRQDPIEQYLEKYAESSLDSINLMGQFQYVLVIPAFDEAAAFWESLLPADAENVLLIVVANVPEGAASAAVARTRAMLAGRSPGFHVLDQHRNLVLLLIERIEEPLPRRRGVGLARKLGSDVALQLIQQGMVTDRIIYMTDADAKLPLQYFGQAEPDAAATIFPFRHNPTDSAIAPAAARYDLHLRYYVNRLRYANSPYGFHTLGSTIAVSALHYALVRGVPRRNGAEDFYLLNKLAKTGLICSLVSPVIELQARDSMRVPFGTGPAIRAGAHTSYNSSSFDWLARVWKFIVDAPAFSDAVPGVPSDLLGQVGFSRVLARFNELPTSESRWRRGLGEWFDAFRTLKFVHGARYWFPDQPLETCLEDCFGKQAPASILITQEKSARHSGGLESLRL